MPAPRRQHRSARGFSLIEISIVVIIIGIVAVSAIPAFSHLSATRRAAAGGEIERMLCHARARAVAEGRPHAIRIEVSSGRLTPYEISSQGSAPTVSLTSDGRTDEGLLLPTAFPGVSLSQFIGGDGVASASGWIWFGTDGSPQTRNASGGLVAECTQDASLTVSNGDTIVVTRRTGAISR
ncbi:MAG: prepilin-type N-terminal cleavage/methylation domain-containing protein [Phycisphaerales bacterium]